MPKDVEALFVPGSKVEVSKSMGDNCSVFNNIISTTTFPNREPNFPRMSGHPPSPPPALVSGTFSSTLPTIEDLLGLIYRLAEGDSTASDEVVVKAKAISAQLAGMRSAATSLPGGHLGTDAVRELTKILEEQAQAKRNVLQAFCASSAKIDDGESRASPST